MDETFQIPLHLRSAPQFADLDGDGDLDILSGVNGGGIIYYENRNIVGIDPLPRETPQRPSSIALLKNYPNPFNPETRISYEILLAISQLGKTHRLTIYDILGQKIREWEFPNNQARIIRSVIWDAKNHAGSPVASGIYFYQLSIDNRLSLTRKMILIR